MASEIEMQHYGDCRLPACALCSRAALAIRQDQAPA
jgi:hypothetical protein